MMISKEENYDFIPFKSLVFYKRTHQIQSDDFYSEICDIEDGQFTASRPLTETEYLDIIKMVDARRKNKSKRKKEDFTFSGFIDRQIISYKVEQSSLSICWVVPAHKNTFLFKKQVGHLKYPNLIFKVENKALYIYSYKGTVNEKTILYKAPFPNIYENGSMCFGNMDVKKLLSKDVSKLIRNFESSFFNSGFNALESSNRTKSNTFELLKRLMKTGEKFPTSELVKTDKRVKDVISRK